MTVKVSSKYQVVIPEHIRHSLGIKAGTSVEVLAKGRIVYLVPVPDLETVQDDLKGLNSKNLREKKDRKV